jgi:NAD(P)-dependent dehydrogenase (short-subunit alcohol dehydrogenase family)
VENILRELEGKVAAVTGAASGIGRALAERWAAEGMAVALGDRDEEALAATAAALREAGATVWAGFVDVANQESVQRWADEAYNRLGNVSLLCNNAGILGAETPRLKPQHIEMLRESCFVCRWRPDHWHSFARSARHR